jgi:putative addiction module CopG family antidote
MTVNLPSDVISFVNSQVESGAFRSPDEVVRAAMQLFEQETERQRQEAKLRQMLEEAMVQVREGQTVDVDQAFDEVESELFGEKLTDE